MNNVYESLTCLTGFFSILISFSLNFFLLFNFLHFKAQLETTFRLARAIIDNGESLAEATRNRSEMLMIHDSESIASNSNNTRFSRFPKSANQKRGQTHCDKNIENKRPLKLVLSLLEECNYRLDLFTNPSNSDEALAFARFICFFMPSRRH